MNGTLTLTNSGDEAAVLSFAYSVSGGYDTFTIAGISAAASGNYSVDLAAGGSLKIYLVATAWKNATVKLTDVKLEVASDAQITVSHNGYGTVSVGGTEAASGTTVEVAAEGATIAATPASGATFLGWVNAADNSVVSTSASLNYVPTGDASLKAIFAKTDSNACFWGSSNTYLFDSLLDATAHASNVTDKTIVLAADGTLPAGNYTIPSGVKFLIPYKDGDTGMFVEPTASNGYLNETKGTTAVYRTMTMANGANLTVNGIMNVNAQQYVSSTPNTNQVADGYGCIKMNSGSTITIGNGGTLYCYGYIWGDGTVEAVSGAKVYERLETQDWRGGTVTSEWKNKYDCFVISQYYVQNIEADYIVNAGAKSYSSIGIQASLTTQVSNPMYIGASGDSALFNLSSGKLIRSYDGKTDRMTYDVYGDFTFNSLSMSISSIASINSKDYILPLNNAITLNMNSGTLTIKYPVKMLPGSQVNITSNANMAIESTGAMYIYDAADISGTTSDGTSKSYYYTGIQGAAYSPTRSANSGKRTTPYASAQLVIDGTLTANGPVYTSEQAGTDVNKVLKGSGTFYNNYSSYSESVEIDELWQDSWSTTYGALTVKCVPVVGHLAGISTDSTYTSLSNGTYYGLPTNYWYQWKVTGEGIAITGDHKLDDSTGVAATGGSVTFTVAKGSTATASNGELTAAEDGVTYTLSNISEDTAVTVTGACTHEGTVNAFAEIPATCVEDGTKAYWQCTACELYYADETCTTEIPDLETWKTGEGLIEATGHSYESVVTAPTCTAGGYTTHTCTACGDSYVTDEVETVGHSYKEEITTAATCEADGMKTLTCTTCGDSYTETITKLGHDMQQTAAEVAPTCEMPGKTAIQTCANNCGKTEGGEDIPATGHKDENKDHACDNGCDAYQGTHADSAMDNDHVCDYCGKEIENGETCSDVTTDKDHKCDVCGKENVTKHEYTSEVTAPTCTTGGYTTHTCNCGHSYTDSEVAAGHTIEQVAAQAKTCTQEGWDAYEYCTQCDYTTKVVIPAGHTIKQGEAQTKTCTQDGWEAYEYCTECDYTTKVVIPAGHTIKQGEAQTKTCTQDGWEAYEYCTECDYTTKVVIPAGHVIEQGAAQTKTCTQDGWEAYEYCTECDYTTKVVIPAGHTLTQVEGKTPTCTEVGHEAYEECSVCDYTTYKEIAATQHNIVIDEAVAPTCTTAGLTKGEHCTKCDYKVAQESVPATDHANKAPGEAKAATCTEAGNTAGEYCPDCKTWIVEQETIPVLDHKFTTYDGNDEIKTAVCDYGCGATDVKIENTDSDTAVDIKPDTTNSAKVNAEVGKEQLDKVVEEKLDIQMNTGILELIFESEAVQDIVKDLEAKDKVTINVENATPEDAENSVRFDIYIAVNDKKQESTKFSGEYVTVTIDLAQLEATLGDPTKDVEIWYVDENGDRIEKMKHEKDGTKVKFKTNHFSYYEVVVLNESTGEEVKLTVNDPANDTNITSKLEPVENGYTLTLKADDTTNTYVYLVKYIDADGNVSEKIAKADGMYTDGVFAIPKNVAAVAVESALAGDVNLDGKINSKDLTRLEKFLAELVELDELNELAADTKMDDKVNSKDITRLEKYLADIIDSFE